MLRSAAHLLTVALLLAGLMNVTIVAAECSASTTNVVFIPAKGSC